jgi:phage tail sheath protein FI
MPEYLSPGVYVEEISMGPKPIEGVSTSTAGFVGQTERGPTSPRLVTSWLDFQRWFGGYVADSYLPYAVQGFFDNGGQRVFVARVVGDGAGSAVRNLVDADDDPVFVAQAMGPGEWGNNLLMRIKAGTQADPDATPPRDLFRLTLLYYREGVPSPFIDPIEPANLANPLRREPDVVEDYDNLSAVVGSANYVRSVVNSVSRLINLEPVGDNSARPADTSFAETASLGLPTGDPNTVLLVEAMSFGDWANSIQVTVADGTDANTFKITVKGKDPSGQDIDEEYDNLTTDNVEDTINDASQLVQVSWAAVDPSNPKVTPSRPDNTEDPANPPTLEGGSDEAVASLPLATGDPNTVLLVEATSVGDWANSIQVTVADGTDADTFKITVKGSDASGQPFDDEEYDNLTTDNVLDEINQSQHVKVSWAAADPDKTKVTPSRPNDADAAELAGGEGGFGGGSDVKVSVKDYIGDADRPANERTGLAGLEVIDEISLLLVPDEVLDGFSAVTDEMIKQCENLKDRFAIASVSQGESNVSALRPPQDTSYAAFYYPWINVFDPSINYTRLIPPTGHIAGIFARTDVERGVHKAPANEVVRGARDMEFPVTKGMQDMLNPRGVNCIRDFRSDGRGIRLWGARTMASDAEWKYVNVRRLFLFVEESIDEGTQWVVFEPNDEPTWARVRRSITNFLISVWRSGALMGTTQDEAFFVKCDRTTMTQDDIDNGRLICYVGIAPVKPAEFVIFRISQKTVEATA